MESGFIALEETEQNIQITTCIKGVKGTLKILFFKTPVLMERLLKHLKFI